MKFTIPPNKSYKEDIKILHESLLSGENISFSKFCDGEWAVINNQSINNKEFWFDPSNSDDQVKRKKLIEAFQFKHDQYFVGITCVNVFGLETHRQMKNLCKQEESHLTWADIWVNSNYRFYLENIVPIFKTKPIILFCNENGKTDNLPFKPSYVFPVSQNAWDNENSWEMINTVKQLIIKDQWKDCIFLFCCGPFGNILCHEFTACSSENTYLDIGSTLNPFLKSAGFERDYYLGNNYFSNMTGAWDQ
jgi:hypothetical protein